MNPQIDKNKNTCMSVKFTIKGIPLERFSDNEIASIEKITMIIEFKELLLLSSYNLEDCPFCKLFVKYYKEINDFMCRTMHGITHDMLNKLITIPGFEYLTFKFYDDNYLIVLEIPIKNPKYSEPAAN